MIKFLRDHNRDGNMRNGKIPATKNKTTPIKVYWFFLSIIPIIMSSILITAIIGGIICEKIITDEFTI